MNEVTFDPKLTRIEDVDLSLQPQVEIIKNPPEWKYVEQLIPSKTVPAFGDKAEYPSGWTPQTKEAFTQSYFVKRTKNGQIPVYLKATHRNMKKVTTTKFINGDIWELHREMVAFIEDYMQQKIRTRVNEFNGQIHIHGDYVNLVKDFLLKKGL